MCSWVGSCSDETTIAGEANSWGGEGEGLLSRPSEAMSSTKEGRAVIGGVGGGGRGQVPWATLEREGVMGSLLLNGWASSSVGRHSERWITLEDDKRDGRQDNSAFGSLALAHSVDHLSPLPPINHESTTTGGQFPARRLPLHGPETGDGVSLRRCAPPTSVAYSSHSFPTHRLRREERDQAPRADPLQGVWPQNHVQETHEEK